MRKVSYTIMIPDDMDINSVIINLEHKPKASEQYSTSRKTKQDFLVPFKSEEPDEGLLYDELY